jgi:hypothetical protein
MVLSIRVTDGPDPVREAARARTGGGIPRPVVPTDPDSMAPWRAHPGVLIFGAVFWLILRRELRWPSWWAAAGPVR